MEQRVKTLEQEMKILKNQIQKTLLDVQEQVLLRYHPALRSDEGTANGNGNGNGNRYGNAEKSHLTETTYQDHPSSTSTPLVRQISLADLRSTPASTNPDSTAAGQDNFTALAAWVAESVGQVGGERTRKILALRAAASGITPHIHDTLNELITLYSNDEEMRQGADMLQQLNHLLDTERSPAR